MPPTIPNSIMPMYDLGPRSLHTPPKKVTTSTKNSAMKLRIMPIKEFVSSFFDSPMQIDTYPMVYHKNAVVNWLHPVPFWPFITVMNTAEINEATVAPPMWGRHFVKLRFTKVTPIAIPDIINGTAWLNFDMPNNSSNFASAALIQSVIDESGDRSAI